MDPSPSAHALHSKEDWKQARQELQAQIDAWDPVGLLAAGGPSEEYECLVWPLMHRLDRGAEAEELSGWLSEEISRHFGVHAPADIDAFSRRTAKAFHARWPGTPLPDRG